MAMSPETKERLARWLRDTLGARAVKIVACERLTGGAIQENLALDVEIDGGPRAGVHSLVLRTDAASGVAVSWDRLQEFAILQVAHRAGVRVPEPWVACADPAVIGRPFYLMGRLFGEARGVKLVRDRAVVEQGDRLAAALAHELAMLHRVTPPVPELEFIPVPKGDPMRARIDELRRWLDEMGQAQPVIEWGLRWLERHAPSSERLCLVHADFRTGNYMVQNGELVGVLDWEFAGFSDPLEDLGWLLAKCWRFGVNDRDCGGIGSRAALLDAYEKASGQPVNRAAIPYWEVLATLRWAVIALMQSERHYSGGERSLELALTSHVVPVLETDLLDHIAAIENGSAVEAGAVTKGGQP